jgi:hypothetical protein|nr:MAG TPA: hypothetical protein [Caudoviricetes sp.]
MKNNIKSRRAYNKKLAERKRKVTLIKGSLGMAAFFMVASIAGNIDTDAYNGIHKVNGTVEASEIIADNGNTYDVDGFQDGTEVTIKLNGQGEVLSIVSK